MTVGKPLDSALNPYGFPQNDKDFNGSRVLPSAKCALNSKCALKGSKDTALRLAISAEWQIKRVLTSD